MGRVNHLARVVRLRATMATWCQSLSPPQRSALFWCVGLSAAIVASMINPDPAYAQNLESFASKVRGLLSSTLLRTLAVIAVIVCGLLWFTGRASTTVLITVIIGIAIVFSADSIVGLIAG